MATKLTKVFGSTIGILAAGLMASLAPATNGAVIVTAGPDSASTAWDATPTLGAATPATDAFTYVGANPIEQTFTVSSSFQLGRIDFVYAINTGNTANLKLYIWEMGSTEDPVTEGFADGRNSNLLSDNTYTITGTSKVNQGVLTFDLTGSDQITLTAGHSYVVAMSLPSRNFNLPVGYTEASDNTDANSAYVGGALFYNENYISGGDAGTDAAFALYAVPEPATLALFGIGGGLMFIRRRRI